MSILVTRSNLTKLSLCAYVAIAAPGVRGALPNDPVGNNHGNEAGKTITVTMPDPSELRLIQCRDLVSMRAQPITHVTETQNPGSQNGNGNQIQNGGYNGVIESQSDVRLSPGDVNVTVAHGNVEPAADPAPEVKAAAANTEPVTISNGAKQQAEFMEKLKNGRWSDVLGKVATPSELEVLENYSAEKFEDVPHWNYAQNKYVYRKDIEQIRRDNHMAKLTARPVKKPVELESDPKLNYARCTEGSRSEVQEERQSQTPRGAIGRDFKKLLNTKLFSAQDMCITTRTLSLLGSIIKESDASKDCLKNTPLHTARSSFDSMHLATQVRVGALISREIYSHDQSDSVDLISVIQHIQRKILYLRGNVMNYSLVSAAMKLKSRYTKEIEFGELANRVEITIKKFTDELNNNNVVPALKRPCSDKNLKELLEFFQSNGIKGDGVTAIMDLRSVMKYKWEDDQYNRNLCADMEKLDAHFLKIEDMLNNCYKKCQYSVSLTRLPSQMAAEEFKRLLGGVDDDVKSSGSHGSSAASGTISRPAAEISTRSSGSNFWIRN